MIYLKYFNFLTRINTFITLFDMQQIFAGNLHINTCPTYKPAIQLMDTEKLKHNTTNKEIITVVSSSMCILVFILANNQCISANLYIHWYILCPVVEAKNQCKHSGKHTFRKTVLITTTTKNITNTNHTVMCNKAGNKQQFHGTN